MSYCRGHAAYLSVLSFNKFEGDPTVGDALAKANGRFTRRHCRLRIEENCAAGKGLMSLNFQARLQLSEGGHGGDAFHLHPIGSSVRILRVQQPLIQIRLIAQEQQSFGIGVEAANGIHARRKTKIGERAMRRSIRRKLRNNSVRLVEDEQHKQRLKWQRREVSAGLRRRKVSFPARNAHQPGRCRPNLLCCRCRRFDP